MTGPAGNGEFCFLETLNVPRGEAECFVIPPNSKQEKIPKKSFALRQLAHKFLVV